jgi:hypothetical protein
VDNISQDKQKLLKVMQELEKDYQAGNISEDKYQYLSDRYSNKLANLNATNRIRSMQGRDSSGKPSSPSVQRSMAEANRREDQDLVNKYVVKQKNEKSIKKGPEVSNKGKYAIISVVFLIIAFLGGISFGLFSDPQTALPTASVMIDDTSFPGFLENATNITINNSTTNSSDNLITDTNSSSDESTSENSNRTSNGSNNNEGSDNGGTGSTSDSGDTTTGTGTRGSTSNNST